jgi:truncated hemoglobin YjbI
VAQFYQYVLCDDKVSEFFLENVSDIPKLHSTMVLFLTHLFGGENHYKGPNMVELHKNMKIKIMHFDVTWDHMHAAFKYFNIEEVLIQDIKQRVYALTGQIVTIKE